MTAEIETESVDFGDAGSQRAPTNPVAGLKHQDFASGRGQSVGRHEPGDTCPNDYRVHGAAAYAAHPGCRNEPRRPGLRSLRCEACCKR